METSAALSLAQTPSSVLTGAVATQSSTYTASYSAVASNAIDGKKGASCNWASANSVTATNSEATPWWSVKLAKPYLVSTVSIYNRLDCC